MRYRLRPLDRHVEIDAASVNQLCRIGAAAPLVIGAVDAEALAPGAPAQRGHGQRDDAAPPSRRAGLLRLHAAQGVVTNLIVSLDASLDHDGSMPPQVEY